ncbi:hypothetical protein PQQ59_05980 [Paraburkholderia aspalathi]|uniref:hypothetical protein n=1 Tax=Paraburkholderia aspalathi TaxID=1324617 RepID=UPI0038BB22D3
MSTMRAKMLVMSVSVNSGADSTGQPITVSEQLRLAAVGPNHAYNEDGSGDEDNSFSRWTPCASLDITIQNPALFGQFKYGDKFYVDFTPADQPPVVAMADAAPAVDDAAEAAPAAEEQPAAAAPSDAADPAADATAAS